MAKAKSNLAAEDEAPVSTQERIARLLALLVVKGDDTEIAALKLDAVGFSGNDIGRLLGVNASYVRGARFKQKNAAKKKKKG